MKVMRIVRGVKFATVVLAALAIAGCAKQQIDQTAMAGSAAPGSQQDFVVNVGDRILRNRFHRAHAAGADDA